MTFEFTPAVRQNLPLLIGLAGPTGSGKTYSALRFATGLSGGKPFAVIDTENGRAQHYADEFDFHHGPLGPPFIPERYAEAIHAADEKGYPVIVVDSASHEHAGDGGLLDMHMAELERMGGRESASMAAWVQPKHAHKKFVSKLLQVRAHVILCFRAEPKVEMVKDARGRMEVVPKRSLVGLDGWIPVSEKNLPYELTMSLLFTPDRPGVPRPVKLQQQHRLVVPLDQPIGEESGVALGAWAKGQVDEQDERVLGLVGQLLECADELGKRDAVTAAVQKNRRQNPDGHVAWLQKQLDSAQAAVRDAAEAPEDLDFGPEGSGQGELSDAA